MGANKGRNRLHLLDGDVLGHGEQTTEHAHFEIHLSRLVTLSFSCPSNILSEANTARLSGGVGLCYSPTTMVRVVLNPGYWAKNLLSSEDLDDALESRAWQAGQDGVESCALQAGSPSGMRQRNIYCIQL